MPRSRSRSRSPRRRRNRSRETRYKRVRQNEDKEDSVASRRSANSEEKKLAFQEQRSQLPVGQYKDDIIKIVKENQIIVCIGETGSGKTTQIPQFLLEAGFANENKRIGITQPRRVATVAVAKRVGEELESYGHSSKSVGYTIRFDDHTSSNTKIKFMTDGILVRECLQDPLLSAYNIIMLDEAHERSIHTDILFGLLQSILKERQDLKLIVTSATLDAEKFSKYFHDCPIFHVPGRSFPVDIYHSKQHQIMGKSGPVSTYIQAAVDTTMQIHLHEPEGHILVFLTGQKEIDDACSMLQKQYERALNDQDIMPILILPLYGALSSEKQRRIFDEPSHGERKVIVCTNIAETSLTVDRVKYVVDSGFTKQKVYNPSRGMESLVVLPISQVSAQQRAGRAGRTSAGKCYRLYSKQSYESMFKETIPEIQRSNLSNTILYLKVLGIDDVLGFSYLDPPEEDSILDALLQLYTLGALDECGQVTSVGHDMAQFPLEPRLARVLLEAIKLDCAHDITRIVAMLSVENVILPHQEKEGHASLLQEYRDSKGDHMMLLRLFNAWKSSSDPKRWCELHGLHSRAFYTASNIQNQLQDLVEKAKISRVESMENSSRSDRIRQAVCAGFFQHAAQKCMMQPVYRVVLSNGVSKEVQLVHFHPSSVFGESNPPQVCVYHELVHTSRAFMRNVLEVNPEWLKIYQPKKELKLIECYALTNRPVPISTIQDTIEIEVTANDTTAKQNEKITQDAVAAAKARYLQRKSQTKRD